MMLPLWLGKRNTLVDQFLRDCEQLPILLTPFRGVAPSEGRFTFPGSSDRSNPVPVRAHRRDSEAATSTDEVIAQ
jgi:hypothetical protein